MNAGKISSLHFATPPGPQRAEHVDIARALAVFIAADRGIVVVKSRKANQSDYETALRVAASGMSPKPMQSRILIYFGLTLSTIVMRWLKPCKRAS